MSGGLSAFLKPGTKVSIRNVGDDLSVSSTYRIQEVVTEGLIVVYTGSTSHTAMGDVSIPSSNSEASFIPWAAITKVTPVKS